jgi:hypothetical protein
MTADNNSTEDNPDPTPFKVYSMTNEARSKRMRGRAHEGICLQGAGYQICSPTTRAGARVLVPKGPGALASGCGGCWGCRPLRAIKSVIVTC